MRMKLLVCASIVAAAAALPGAQDPPRKAPDDRVITVTGCVDKGYLRVSATDSAGSYAERYRLRGSKQLLKEIAAKFDKHLLEVTGVVTDITGNATHRGKTV